MTDIRDTVLDEVARFTKRTGLAEGTVAGRAVKDSRFIARLRDGRPVALHNVQRLRDWMKAYVAPQRRKRRAA